MKHLRPVPQPSNKDMLHIVLHTWNLPKSAQDLLAVYTSRRMYACQLDENLYAHQGQLLFNGAKYVPIYQNCTRFSIRSNSLDNHSDCDSFNNQTIYFVSFRVYRDMHIALIQPQYNHLEN